MRPSASVTPRATTAPSCSSETDTPDAGRPLAVSRTCVERVAMSGRYRTSAMTMLRVTAGPFAFRARLEEKDAPKTCAAVRKLLPLRSKLVHCRWSGESTWVPMGEKRLGVDFENHTSHPAPRSEEHTSELQSHSELVCRLLLEKKNLIAVIDHRQADAQEDDKRLRGVADTE